MSVPVTSESRLPTRAAVEAELEALLRALRLPAMKAGYREQAELARRESLSFERYLLELVRRESEERHQNRIRRLLKQSRLPLEKSLAAFDRGRLPVKVDHQVSVLVEGGFLDRAENVLAFGTPGSGKTHLVCALAQELVHQGRSVLFRPCSLLVQELLAAKRDLELGKALERLSKYEALVIDDIGYVQQSREEMEVLFTLLAERYERGSVVITSNLPFSQWERIFKDPMTAAAAIDRLIHHSIILELNLPSYRLEVSKERNGIGGAAGSEPGEIVVAEPEK